MAIPVSPRFSKTMLFGLLMGCALLGPSACSSDPAVDGGNGAGSSCEEEKDCAEGLSCTSGTCRSKCDEIGKTDSCESEVCLADGFCSVGLGTSCSAGGSCPTGLVCSTASSSCAVPCTADQVSPACGGDVCKSDGTCPRPGEIVIGGLGGQGGAGNGTGGAENCIDVDVTFEPQVPTVMLLIDRSGSMTDEGGFGNAVDDAVESGDYVLGDCPDHNDWRWNVVRDVLFHTEKGVVKPLESKVRFGLSLYTSHNGSVSESNPEEQDPTRECPVLIDVPIALNNHAAMLSEFLCDDVDGDTPTGESLEAAAATLKAFDEPGPKVIVLATDGEPDSCECPNFWGNEVPAACKQSGAADQVKADVVAAAGSIFEDEIIVHVINVSNPNNMGLQEHLSELADAGGGEVFPGFNPVQLVDAFDEIIDGVRSCKIDLDGEIGEGKEDTGTVKLDGKKLKLGDDDGYRVNRADQIELLGEACDTIKSGDHDIDIKFPCGSFVVVPR